jgi:hypothetical protein
VEVIVDVDTVVDVKVLVVALSVRLDVVMLVEDAVVAELVVVVVVTAHM